MQVQKTIKVKIGEIGKNKQERLDRVLNSGLSAVKEFMELSIKNKTCSNIKLHQLGYKEISKKHNLPATVVHQSRNKAREIIKGWKSNKWRLHKNIDLPQPKALRIRFDNVTFHILKTENKKYIYFASFLCEKRKGKNNNRIYVPLIVNSDYQKEYIIDLLNKNYKKCSADLIKKGNEFFINLVIGKEVNIPQVNRNFTPIGVDIGLNNLAVVTVLGQSVKFFSGKRVLWKKQQINKLKADLQSRHNKKLLSKIKGREVKYIDWINHQISSYIIKQAKEIENPVIVLENLTYILETTRVRKKQRYFHQTWAFKRLQKSIEYKANWEGILLIYISPEFTSQICPKCFSTNKRVKHTYKCKYCKSEYNSDYVGAVNTAKYFFEAIRLEKSAPINCAMNKSIMEPQAMIDRGVQKSILKGGCFSSQA